MFVGMSIVLYTLKYTETNLFLIKMDYFYVYIYIYIYLTTV